MTTSQKIKIAMSALWLLIYVISKMAKQSREDAANAAASQPSAKTLPVRAAPPSVSDAMRPIILQRLTNVEGRARALADEARREARNHRFTELLEAWIPTNARQYITWLSASPDPTAWVQARRMSEQLELVLSEVALLVSQRRDPTLRDEVGAADTLADACYAPIIAFATAHELPLASAFPATQLTDFSLSIWTGFAPTSVAPIFLPPGFFSRAAWWPALAHEIGHDFLLSMPALDLRLRNQLGVPGEREGVMPLQPLNNEAPESEVRRLYGGWFEETFCDIFGTLMCGPGYVASMIELFAPSPDDRDAAREVEFDPMVQGVYDVHPPRYLRVLTCIAVLERVELHDEARALSRRWRALADETEAPDVIYVPTRAGGVEVPVARFMARARELVDALCVGQLEALDGYSLTDIPGLDYGPHEHASTLRVRDALLRGAAIDCRDPRSIISGAVLASIQSPSREATILAAARAMIPSLGAVRRQRDTYSDPQHPKAPRAALITPNGNELVEALIAGEIFGPPRSRRRHGGTIITSSE